MTTAFKGLIAVVFIAILCVLNLSLWANALLLLAFYFVVLFGPAIGHLLHGRR